MNLLMIEVGNEGDNSRDSSVEMEGLERSIDAPICIDEVYNLIVCKDCGIGVPLDWVLWHVKECDGITMTMEQVRMFLKMENDCMTMSQARDWMSSVWVIKAVKNIPIIPIISSQHPAPGCHILDVGAVGAICVCLICANILCGIQGFKVTSRV